METGTRRARRAAGAPHALAECFRGEGGPRVPVNGVRSDALQRASVSQKSMGRAHVLCARNSTPLMPQIPVDAVRGGAQSTRTGATAGMGQAWAHQARSRLPRRQIHLDFPRPKKDGRRRERVSVAPFNLSFSFTTALQLAARSPLSGPACQTNTDNNPSPRLTTLSDPCR